MELEIREYPDAFFAACVYDGLTPIAEVRNREDAELFIRAKEIEAVAPGFMEWALLLSEEEIQNISESRVSK